MRDDKTIRRVAVTWPIVGAIVVACIAACGCTSPGAEIAKGAGQINWMKWSEDGSLEIRGDGTSKWNVTASGTDEGWSFHMTSDPKAAVGGTASIALSNNETLRAGFDLARAAIPFLPAPVPVARLPPEPSDTIPDP